MQEKIIIGPAAILAFFVAAAFSVPPIERMGPFMVGVEYTAAVREQVITSAEVNSVEKLHLLSFYYAPFSFVQVSLGLGSGKFEVEEYRDREYRNRAFDGRYGVSPAAGLHLASPALLNKRVRLLADGEFVYLNSRDGEGYRYRGPVLDPGAGVLFRIDPVVSLEGGGRWHVISGSMSGESGAEKPFSNTDYQRYYLALTAVSPIGVYLRIDLAASEDAAGDFFQDGLKGAALSVNLGALIGQDRKNRELDERNSVFFPEYDRMKKRQEDMSGKIE